MKRTITILLLTIMCSCQTSLQKVRTANPEFEVVQVPIVNQNDTIILNELRFYRISSAVNFMQLFYDEYGKWDLVIDGRYQSNVPQLIWKDIKLTDDHETYTISTCGTETHTKYFASVVVLNKEDIDCLSLEYPKRQIIIDFLVSKMRSLGSSKEFYQEYRTR